MGGNINHFVSEMNDEASEIGLQYALRDTGWQEWGVLTAFDVAKLPANRYRIKIIIVGLPIRRLMIDKD